MRTEVNAEFVKATREKYGMSQRTFALLLGIGEATIVRYEKGAKPTKANANLILAANDPHFMAGCIMRDGDALSARQRAHAEEYVYAFISLDPDEDADEAGMKMNEIYDFTLRQEVLNEQAANIVAEILRYMVRKGIEADDTSEPLAILLRQLFAVKADIISVEHRDPSKLDQIAGYLKYMQQFVTELIDARGVA